MIKKFKIKYMFIKLQNITVESSMQETGIITSISPLTVDRQTEITFEGTKAF